MFTFQKGLLQTCNEMNASYLFQKDKHYNVQYDTGDKTIQCGRHVDVLKCWLMWRAKGDLGFERQIDRLFELANLLEEQCKVRENFHLVLVTKKADLKHEFLNICFWYVPPSLRKEYNMDFTSNEFKEKLSKVAPKIKERMMIRRRRIRIHTRNRTEIVSNRTSQEYGYGALTKVNLITVEILQLLRIFGRLARSSSP